MTTSKFLSGTLFIVACACTGTSTLGNGDESGGGLETTVREACTELLACLPASKEPYSQTECEADLRGGRDQAIAAGCGDLWDTVVACALENPGSCGDEGYVWSPACDADAVARRECMDESLPGGACGGGTAAVDPSESVVECYWTCEEYYVECQGPWGGPVECLCMSGPATGTEFQMDNNCDLSQLSTVSRTACMS
jgi:hypothetical protein